MRALLPAILFAFTACAYVLPASWRAFHADPEDAASAITRALDANQLEVGEFDTVAHRITSGWHLSQSGVTRTRERYLVSWERDEKEDALTVYVRHEVQDHEELEGRPSWSTAYHDRDKETALLDLITEELRRAAAPM